MLAIKLDLCHKRQSRTSFELGGFKYGDSMTLDLSQRRAAAAKKFYELNRQKIIARNVLWKKKNRDKVNAAAKKRRKDEPEKYIVKYQRNYKSSRLKKDVRSKEMIRGAHRRACLKNIPYDSQALEELVKTSSSCACCAHPFIYDAGRHDRAPSIDRINSGMGYVEGNVKMLCWRCNRLKSDATSDELKAIISYIELHGEFARTNKMMGLL